MDAQSAIWTVALAIAVAAPSCGGNADSRPPAAPTAAVATRMHENFEIIDKMRMAVVRGELEEAKTRATELADGLLDNSYPPEWAPHLESVREAVAGTRRAVDLTTAAAGAARAGHACGKCHAALGAEGLEGPRQHLQPSPLPLADFMNRHSWAAERLWEGLIGPSDAAWRLGAKTLAETTPLDTADLTPEMQALAYSLRDFTEQFSKVTSADERTTLYGQFLSTCAVCHRAYLDRTERRSADGD